MIEVKIEDKVTRFVVYWLKTSLLLLAVGAFLFTTTYWASVWSYRFFDESTPLSILGGGIVLVAQIVAGIATAIKAEDGKL